MNKQLLAGVLITTELLGGAAAYASPTEYSINQPAVIQEDLPAHTLRYERPYGAVAVANSMEEYSSVNDPYVAVEQEAPVSARNVAASMPSNNTEKVDAALTSKAAAANKNLYNMFVRLAQCESTSRWNLNTGNSFYGGLQFTKTSWNMAGGNKFAARADYATKDQQIAVATKLLKMQTWKAWPACSLKLGYR